MVKIEAKREKMKNSGYDHSSIELKWQSKWQKHGTYQPDLASAKKPFYNLMMFPYPSAEGLHIGGVRTFGGVDIYGRFQRMRGMEVFQPFGLDGFGIHAENYAMKIGAHPMEHANVTEANYYRQVREAAIGVDWSRTVETYKPDYYKWTQWLFLQLFNAGLAYRKKSPVNFCPGCKTVLADEQVIDGKCERCSSIVEKRDLEQWFFRITKYAERLLGNIEDLNWTDKVRLAQKNWIGKKTGINIRYKVAGTAHTVEVFTTRPDTNFGATFIALAPENPLALEIVTQDQKDKVEKYVKEAKMKSEVERQAEGKEKTGVFTGAYALNELTGYKMPIWVSDFVLAGFGTGALVGVPGHDKRDFEFATKFGLEVIRVVSGKDKDQSPITSLEQVQEEEGTMVNSGFLDGLDIHDATEKIMDYMEDKGYGNREVTYHLRDWLISRQRYWGPPIPMIHCEKCAVKKPKVLLVHGLSGSSKGNWFPWLRHELAAKGYEVLIPDLPNPDNPSLKEWTDALSSLGITKHDRLFIVAHSLGAPVACQFALQNGLKVEKLLLVAPTGNELDKIHFDNLDKAGCSQKGIDSLKRINAANTNLSELQKLVRETVLYLSDNDPYIPLSVEKTYRELKPEVRVFRKKKHFGASDGLTEFREASAEFLPADELNLGWHPAPEKDLPVMLPHIKDFKPLGTGKAPLANHPEFYKTSCPVCGNDAERETDVSDTFLDSAWYFLRYLATDLKDVPIPMSTEKANECKDASDEEIKKANSRQNWLPVTMYIGGAEHSVLHLLYSRFTTMVLHDLGYINFEEPFSRFYAHGLVIKDGAKMSKSKGNVITPDVYIKKFGADTVRTYLHFMGPFNQDGDFRDSGIEGMNRFLRRVWTVLSSRKPISSQPDTPASRFMHLTIKGVTEDMEELRFNTAIAKLMTWYNFLAKQPSITREEVEVYLKLLAPFAPHMTEELWEQLGNEFSIHTSAWPQFEAKFITKDVVTIAIQVNGKLRTTLQVSSEEAKEQKGIQKAAEEDENVKKFLGEGDIKKVIYIPGKILNFVVG